MHQDFQPTVYIMANRKNGATYVGVTSNLMRRIQQHREETFNGHSKKVSAKLLMWYEQHMTMETAIVREKRIKGWDRQWKINMIEVENPDCVIWHLIWGFRLCGRPSKQLSVRSSSLPRRR